MNTDRIRAAFISFLQSLFPVLEIVGIVHLTSDQVAIVMLCITNFITMLFLLLPNPPVTPPAS